MKDTGIRSRRQTHKGLAAVNKGNPALPSCRVSAVLLAAGESCRMGTVNKLGLPVDGVPLLRRTAQLLTCSGLSELVAVLGYQAGRVSALLSGLSVRTVYNESYREGQMASVTAGVTALQQPCDGVMICLADQPLLTVEDIDRLILVFCQRTQGSILVPTYNGERGNPIIFDQRHRSEILRGNRNLGCKRLIEKNPDLVFTVRMANDHVVVDLDTPDDYVLFEELTKNCETA